MENIQIVKIASDDVEALQSIGRQTFSETFSGTNAAEDMNAYLESGFAQEKLLAELENQNSEFYLSTLENETIGYLKINYGNSQTELKLENAVEIERIYVLKSFHGKNVGQLLYNKAIEIARSRNADYVWLGVWEENPRAISFYKKNGFVAFDKHIFRLGNDEQTDIMMKLSLKNQ